VRAAREPLGIIGHRVCVQWDAGRVRILDAKTWKLLREHTKKQRRGQYQTHNEDRPAKTPPTTTAVLMRTARAGKHIGQAPGTRHFAAVAAVPLLIIDDLRMRKLPATAAEDLLEQELIRMRAEQRNLAGAVATGGENIPELVGELRKRNTRIKQLEDDVESAKRQSADGG
jgi:hypothetical protein